MSGIRASRMSAFRSAFLTGRATYAPGYDPYRLADGWYGTAAVFRTTAFVKGFYHERDVQARERVARERADRQEAVRAKIRKARGAHGTRQR